MGLKYLKADLINELELKIEENHESYITNKVLIDKKDFLESSISLKSFKLKHNDKNKFFDIENSKIVYEALKHLTPLEASDGRIWVGMTHTKEGMEYTNSRWGIKEGTSKGTIKDRYFDTPVRNSFSRLWWYGYVSYNESFEDPYTLTELLLKNQDVVQAVMERSFSRNREFVQTLLMALFNFQKKHQIFPKGKDFAEAAKGINRLSAITLVDLIDVKDFEEIIEKYCI